MYSSFGLTCAIQYCEIPSSTRLIVLVILVLVAIASFLYFRRGWVKPKNQNTLTFSVLPVLYFAQLESAFIDSCPEPVECPGFFGVVSQNYFLVPHILAAAGAGALLAKIAAEFGYQSWAKVVGALLIILTATMAILGIFNSGLTDYILESVPLHTQQSTIG